MSAVVQDVVPGHYRILRLLGSGGMGEVYLARDLALDRNVAIKFLSPDHAGDAAARHRLLREAQAAASVDHPAICSVYETGETPDGRAYLVMQYVEGETLAARLQRGALNPTEALSLCAQIADALGAAHKRGIVHRDLKPGNVIVTPSGRPKLLDFGIAKRLPLTALDEESTSSAGTTGGAIVGTPAYMAPEQVQQRPVDGRTDLFALGALLFECLTGRRAFAEPTAAETIGSILHTQPPPVSSLRPELTPQHDVLCWRLLAKDPADRFQSADEVTGAIRMLLPDTGRTPTPLPVTPVPPPARARRPRRRTLLLACAIAAAAVAGIWQWRRVEPLPVPPPDAQAWYERGTNGIREGAYHGARLALEQAIRLFPQYALAYARLAEAYAELDDVNAAQRQLLRIPGIVANESRLPEIERWRLEAIRNLVLRNIDDSRAAYQRIVNAHPRDAGAWLDLGRAHEAAGLLTEAGEAYRRAIALDAQYAAAHLRIGYIEAQQSHRDAAVAAFAEAERLYRAASNEEGETEVLLRRAAMFDSLGELQRARQDLERAEQLAAASDVVYQQVRARLTLSSVMAWDGRISEAERLSADAVREALEHDLDTAAADGLVDLGASLMELRRLADADAAIQRALELAERRRAPRTAARARLQLASLNLEQNRPQDALQGIDRVLPFLKENNYRRYELTALSIASRAHQMLDDLNRAHTIARQVLSAAERVRDEAQIALALGTLASVLTALGEYPEALSHRERAEEIHRRLGQDVYVPYAMVNEADLLIRLGRAAEADEVLTRIEGLIAAAPEANEGHALQIAYLRSFSAVTKLRCGDAVQAIRPARSGAARAQGELPPLLPLMLAFCEARTGRAPRAPAVAEPHEPFVDRERRYWIAATALARSDAETALTNALEGLKSLGDIPNDELRWRLAAVAAAAAARLGRTDNGAATTARDAWARLSSRWGSAERSYRQRVDLEPLRAAIGL